MATIEVKLRDGQNLGYIKIRDGEPYYSYPMNDATHLSLNDAIALCSKLSNTYRFIIHREQQDITKGKIEIV